jgi:hypothetical protein
MIHESDAAFGLFLGTVSVQCKRMGLVGNHFAHCCVVGFGKSYTLQHIPFLSDENDAHPMDLAHGAMASNMYTGVQLGKVKPCCDIEIYCLTRFCARAITNS